MRVAVSLLPTFSNAAKKQLEMYLNNKYIIVYDSIINRTKSRVLDGYGEIHHIIPRILGNKKFKENLVRFTAKHFT